MRATMNPKTTQQPSRTWLARHKRQTKQDLIALQLDEPRRRHSRYATRHLQVESPCHGWVFNVSQSGLCLESLVELVEGAEYTFRLRYGASFLNLNGRVIWSRLDRTETTRRGRIAVCRTGIEIEPGEATSSWLGALDKLTGVALRA